MTRRSPSYEMRLAKYAHRGYSVLVPSLDMTRVDPQIYEKRFDQLQGLARLLLLGTNARFQANVQNASKALKLDSVTSKNSACASSDLQIREITIGGEKMNIHARDSWKQAEPMLLTILRYLSCMLSVTL
jgi:hypothetical protein